jgi:phosphoribosylformylglycinamidine cyclo-ligase
MGAVIDRSAWRPQPVFDVVAEAAGIERDGLYGVLNMGVGMVLVVPPDEVARAIDVASTAGVPAVAIGEVTAEPGIRLA